MESLYVYLAVAVVATIVSTPSSFNIRDIFRRRDVDGVDLTVTDGYGKASAIDPQGVAGAVTEGVAYVNGSLGKATGKGKAEGNGTLDDQTITAFATTTVKKYKILGLDLGYGHVTGGFKFFKNGSTSSEETKQESQTFLSIGLDGKNKRYTRVLPFR